MKILIDIGHPAHVHYFRNFIKIMKSKGHEFLIIARDRQYIFELLRAYGISFVSRGEGGRGASSKLWYLKKTSVKQYFRARRFKPDIFLDFGTIYSCAASMMLRKPHLVFEDTENADLYRMLYKPFVTKIFTPQCFEKDLGRKQIRFSGYMELCYLHKNYFTPDATVLDEVGLEKGERFSIVRFVDWKAVHDIGYTGLSCDDKILLVNELKKYGKVFVSSEIPLPDELEKFRLKIKPEQLHSLMHYSVLVLGESATMASEAVVMGTPAIFIDNVGRGYTTDLSKKYGNMYLYSPKHKNLNEIIEKARQVLTSTDCKKNALKIRDQIQKDSIDVTAFMVEKVLNTPPGPVRDDMS
jgi:predicted glycosyltransferase